MRPSRPQTPPASPTLSFQPHKAPFLPTAQLRPDAALTWDGDPSKHLSVLVTIFRGHSSLRPRPSRAPLGCTRPGSTSVRPRSEILGDLPSQLPRHPCSPPFYPFRGRRASVVGGGYSGDAPLFPPAPAGPQRRPLLPHPRHPVGRGARPGDPLLVLTCSAPASRRPARACGGRGGEEGSRSRCPPVWGPRTRSSVRWGAEGGPAVGRAEGGNGGYAITKPVRLGAGAQLPLPARRRPRSGEGPGGGPGSPRGRRPARRTAAWGPAAGDRALKLGPPTPYRTFSWRARHCEAKQSGAPKTPMFPIPTQVPSFSNAARPPPSSVFYPPGEQGSV